MYYNCDMPEVYDDMIQCDKINVSCGSIWTTSSIVWAPFMHGIAACLTYWSAVASSLFYHAFIAVRVTR